MGDDNGWKEYKLLVLDKLETIEEIVNNIQSRVGRLEMKVSSIFAVSIFLATVTGIVVAVANLVISNFL